MMFAQETGHGLLEQELTWIALLAIAAGVAVLIRRIRLPYTVALVLVGLVLTFVTSLDELPISSDLILALLVPPLLFEATLHLKWSQLKSDWVPIALLAVVGTLLGTLIVGGVVTQLTGIPWQAAFVFGALISATDPVAVIAFFRSLGVSKRLAILVEGESLFNDGVAVVLFSLAVSLAAQPEAGFDLAAGLMTFIQVAFGGIVVGLVLGYVVSVIVLKNVDDHLIETTTTVALAFGSYVIAEQFGTIVGIPDLHFSGILAVVVAGILVGNIGTLNTSPTTQIALNSFWELVAFVVNSIIFLVIGLEINIADLLPELDTILVAVAAVLVARAIVIYSLTWVNNRINVRQHIPLSFRHVMYWGGLRGAISLALALTLTASLGGLIGPVAQQLRLMTFGVVLFTLLVQGTTIAGLIRRLGLAQRPSQELEQQRRQALLYANQAGKRELDRLRENNIISENIWQAMSAVYKNEIDRGNFALREHLQAYPELERAMMLQARADVLQAERSAITDAARRGLISEDVYHQLVTESNDRAAALELVVSGGKPNGRPDGEPLTVQPPATPVGEALNHIVVATRGGEGSRVVKQHAVSLARESGARLTFLYVVDVAGLGREIDEQLQPAVRQELTWLGHALLGVARQRAEQFGVKADIAIREGAVREVITRFLQEEQADLLLLGAPRGTTGNVFGDDTVEQFALSIETSTSVPVKIVRPDTNIGALHEVRELT